MRSRTLIILGIVGTMASLGLGANPVLQSQALKAEFSRTQPGLVQLTDTRTAVSIAGPAAGQMQWSIRANGQWVKLADCQITLSQTKDALRYRIDTQRQVGFDLVATIKGDELRMAIENIAGKLQEIRFAGPELNVSQADGPWQLATAEMMHGGKMGPALGVKRSNKADWAILSNGKVALSIHNTIVRDPITVQSDPMRCSLGSNDWHYALKDGHKSPVFAVTIGMVGDLNSDKTVDWQDGAIFCQRHVPGELPKLIDTHLLGWVGIESAGNSPGMNATFAQVQNIIRRQYYLTGGEGTMMGLAGWSYWGWDSEYPACAEASRRAGGNAGLVALCKDAWRWGESKVSLCINFDDAYKHSPAWDIDIMCTRPDGSPQVYMYWMGGLAYHICPYKDVKTGKAFERIDTMFDFGTGGSCYIDVLSADGAMDKHSSGPGGEISWMDNLVAGKFKIAEYYWKKGLKLYSEHCTYPFIGRILGGLNNRETGLDAADRSKIPLPAYILHGKMNNFFSATRYGRAGKVLLGIVPNVAGHVGSPNDDHLDAIYLHALVTRPFVREKMKSFSFDGKRFIVKYTNDTQTSMDANGANLEVVYKGRKIADSHSMFVPRPKGGYWAYADKAGLYRFPIPDGWSADTIRSFILNRDGAHQECDAWAIEYADGKTSIVLSLNQRVPLLLTNGTDVPPARIEGYGRRKRTVRIESDPAKFSPMATHGRDMQLDGKRTVLLASDPETIRITLPDPGEGKYVAFEAGPEGIWAAMRVHPDEATYRDKRKRPKDRVVLVSPAGKTLKDIAVMGPVSDLLYDKGRNRLYIAAGVFNLDGVQTVDLKSDKVIGHVPLTPDIWGSDLRLAMTDDVLYVAAPQTQNLAAIRLDAAWPKAAEKWSDRIFVKHTDPRDPEAALDEFLRIRWDHLATIHELGAKPIGLAVDGKAVLISVAGLYAAETVRIEPVDGPTQPQPEFKDPFDHLARAIDLPREQIVATNLPGNARPWWLTLPEEKHQIIPEPRPADTMVWYNVGPRCATIEEAKKHAALIVALKTRSWARSKSTMPLVNLGESQGLPRGKLRNGHDYWMVGYIGVRDNFSADDVMKLPGNEWYVETLRLPDGSMAYRAGIAAKVTTQKMDELFAKALASEAKWYRDRAAQAEDAKQKKLYLDFAKLFEDARKQIKIQWF